MLKALTQNWWVLVLRGALLILFAILVFVNPGLTALTLAMWLAILLAADGVVSLFSAVRSWTENEDRWLLLADGVISLLLGILLFRAPGVTLLFMALTFAIWFLFSGVVRIAMGVQLRKEIKGEGWMIFGGVISVILGLYMFARPDLSLSTMLLVAGVFALMGGIFLVMVGLKVRKADKWLDEKKAQLTGTA